MPLCGFNPQMLHGLTELAQGLYKQALKRSREDRVTLERAFEIEVEEMNIFLTKLDARYYDDLRPEYNADEAMERLLNWADEYRKEK